MTADPFRIVGSLLEGRYRVERVAGEGGFGVVYRAFHVGFEAPVAIKVLKLPGSATPDQRAAFLESFRAEGKLLFELSSLHEAIVQARETGTVVAPDGKALPFLVLEWLEGAPLEREIRYRRERSGQPFTLLEALTVLEPVFDALAVAHARGIAHRDIKPGNIFLARKGLRTVAKILDFGFAKVAVEGASTTAMFEQTTDLRLPFTPAYGAPEQFLRRLGATGPWTDTYALALVLVEMLTNERALRGSDPAQFMGATSDETTRPTPRALGADTSDEVERVFLRALGVDPRARFRDARVFWDALCDAGGWSRAAAPAPDLLAIGVLVEAATPPPSHSSRARPGTTQSTWPDTCSTATRSTASALADYFRAYVGSQPTGGPVPWRGLAWRLLPLVGAGGVALTVALVVVRSSHSSLVAPLPPEQAGSFVAEGQVPILASHAAGTAQADPPRPTEKDSSASAPPPIATLPKPPITTPRRAGAHHAEPPAQTAAPSASTVAPALLPSSAPPAATRIELDDVLVERQ